MHPILLRYGALILYTYTAALGLGILAGLALTAQLARGQPVLRWIDGWLWALAAALVGGRVGFVLLEWSYFQTHPVAAWQLWRGGLAYHGALVAGFLGLWTWARWQKRPFAPYAALFAPALALISAAGWAACYFEGCAYGRETTLGLLAANLPDVFGVFAVRYQTQLLGLVGSLAILGLALWLGRRRGRDSRNLWNTLGALSLLRLPISLLRGDPFPTLGALRLDTLLDGLLVLTCLLLLQYTAWKLRRTA